MFVDKIVKGGAQKIREKKSKKLAEDASKCQKLTDMFSGSTVGARPTTAAAATAESLPLTNVSTDVPLAIEEEDTTVDSHDTESDEVEEETEDTAREVSNVVTWFYKSKVMLVACIGQIKGAAAENVL